MSILSERMKHLDWSHATQSAKVQARERGVQDHKAGRTKCPFRRADKAKEWRTGWNSQARKFSELCDRVREQSERNGE